MKTDMKKAILILVITVFSINILNAQAPVIKWQATLGGTSTDVLNAFAPTPDGGFIAAGGSQSSDGDVSFNNGDQDVWVTKLNYNGQIQWEKSYGVSDNESVHYN